MKKIFMVSLVAMMAVTAANADIASTTYVDTYVDTRAGEMQLDQNGNLTNAGYYVGTDQKLQFIGQADALNTAIGKLDDAIATQATEDGNTYVKKADANEDKKGGTAGTFVYSVSQLNGDVTAEQGAFLSEIVSGDLPAAQVNAYKVAPQAGAVKSYVDGAISSQGSQVTALSGRVGSLEEYVAGNEQKGIESLDKRLEDKQDVSDKDYQLGNKDGGWTTMSDAQQNALNSGVTTDVVGKANSALQKADIVTGSTNGTIKVDDKEVSVHGLGTAAYTNSDAYATAAQGGKADSALQKADIVTGSTNGTIKVDDKEVAVKGLGTAAYTNSDAYATAAQGDKADAALPAESLTKAALDSEDGVYTLTMKKQGETLTYYWEKIGR